MPQPEQTAEKWKKESFPVSNFTAQSQRRWLQECVRGRGGEKSLSPARVPKSFQSDQAKPPVNHQQAAYWSAGILPGRLNHVSGNLTTTFLSQSGASGMRNVADNLLTLRPTAHSPGRLQAQRRNKLSI